MDIKFQDLAFDAVLPSAILFNQNIEPNAIKLYAFVRGLSRVEGYCYATNKYLAECMGCDQSTVKRLLTSLKAEGFVEIQLNKEGIHWQRCIFVGNGLKKCLRRLKNEPPPAQKRAPPSSKMSYNKRYIIEDIEKEEREAAPPPRETASPPPTQAPLFLESKDIPFAYKRVKMKVSDHQALIHDFGEEKINEMLDRLDEYADINPRRFKQYANHSTVIRKWIRDDSSNPKSSRNALNAPNFIQKIKRIPGVALRCDIVFGRDYIEFPRVRDAYFKFGEPSFEEKVKNTLRKMGIDVSSLK